MLLNKIKRQRKGHFRGMCIMRYSHLMLILVPIGMAQGADPQKDGDLIVKPDAFKTLVNPQCSHCRDEAKRRSGELRDYDRVLCWIRGKYDGGAIPIRFFLNPYRVISDTYGVFVYDADAGFARGYAPSLEFTFHGWRNGVMVMKNKDGTLYSCLSGAAFDGPNKGRRLEVIPTLTSDWGFWLKHYPGTVAYHMFDKYQPVELPTAPNADSEKSRSQLDNRLPADTPVLGVFDGKMARAYPLAELARKRVIHDTVDGKNRVLLWHEPTQTAAAYWAVAADSEDKTAKANEITLRFAPRDAAQFVDEKTNSAWDITGRAVSGKLKGQTLTWLDSTQVKWFAWAAEYPQTTIYGK
jgi:hypothetical protein